MRNKWNITLSETNDLTSSITVLLATIFVLLFIIPWLSFWTAYFTGWITKIVIGKYLVEGFALLGITLPLDKIPLLAGIFGWIGGFFKTLNTSKK